MWYAVLKIDRPNETIGEKRENKKNNNNSHTTNENKALTLTETCEQRERERERCERRKCSSQQRWHEMEWNAIVVNMPYIIYKCDEFYWSRKGLHCDTCKSQQHLYELCELGPHKLMRTNERTSGTEGGMKEKNKSECFVYPFAFHGNRIKRHNCNPRLVYVVLMCDFVVTTLEQAATNELSIGSL